MNFNFNKSNKSTIDLNKILEEVGGVETSIGKNVGRKIDELEAEELKKSFIKRSFILNNKENNTEKKEKLEDLEDNEFKKIKDSVFIDYNKNVEFLSEEKKYQNNYLQFNNLDSLLEKHSLSTEK
jgi:transcription antitermination factor NusG